jgi:hypothetical protein
MMTQTAAAATRPPPSPDEPVPDEFDLLCEHCGYSLVGLISSNRCPECGMTFDPNQLPLARIPWLYRARRGVWSTYIHTVWQVLVHPSIFAAELCRPVRISAEDARAFRRRTIRIAVAAFFVAELAILALVIGTVLWKMQAPSRGWIGFGLRAGILTILAAVGAWLMLVVATDQPTFIWKGLGDAPYHLSPAQHYAAAPLALVVFLGVIVLAIAGYAASIHADLLEVIGITASSGLGIVAVLLIAHAIVFMRVASRCSWRRTALLALYLPVHYAMIFMISVAFVGASMALISMLLDAMGIRTM